ncbi:MAG: hypothetical protein LV480_03350 [Methylacidiphilales bacterium]|nr:hypothetical protein [Candidatus Methylacidiphilales bacterium]
MREAAELLVSELSTLSSQEWEKLPDLKKKKVVLAGRLRQFEWPSGPADPKPFELMALKTLVTDLESHSREKIQAQLDLIRNQIQALQDLHQYWRESLSVSFRKLVDPVPSS